jgi:hypothetical protein
MTRNDHNDPGHPGQHAAAHGHASHAHHHARAQHSHQQHPHHHAAHHAVHEPAVRRQWSALRRGVVRFLRRPMVQRIFWGSTVTMALVVVAGLGLWWRLASGPIEFDMATPWLKAAIEENFGGKHTVSVGGTQLERDEDGRPSLRLRDIVVRDADGTVVASAPKAEVGISGLALLRGQVRARSLNLVGAEMAVRIEKNGTVTVFAGANKRPIATAPPVHTPPSKRAAIHKSVPPGALRAGVEDLTGLMAWIDGLGATGLDGHDLRELGLKNGNLTVDDERNGKHWSFSRINVSLMRPQEGGLTFRLASENPKRPWVLSAAMRPLDDGARAIGLEARNVSSADILLALRMNESEVEADLPLSASVRAEVSTSGVLQHLQGQVLAGHGDIVDHGDDGVVVPIDGADIRFSWAANQHALVVPFQIRSGGNQFTLQAILHAPTDRSGVWTFNVTRGDPVIDPIILASPGEPDTEGFAINRVAMHGRIETKHDRIDLDQGDLSRVDTRPLYNIGLAVTGSLDYSGATPHLAFGVAGTRMPGSVLKRIWPIFANYPVRQWVDEHIFGGVVERVVIAGNAPLANFRSNGPPMPEDGLSIALETSGTTLHPIQSLPEIHDADLTLRVSGRHAVVSLGRGTVDLPGDRKLNVADGVFDVPDMYPKPALASAHFRIDGAVPAVAALLSSKDLHDKVGALNLDPQSTRGSVAARVAVNLQIATKVHTDPPTYAITADLTNFAADKMLMGRKVEASSLRVSATDEGYEIKGDVKVNGTPAVLDLQKQKGADAEVHIQAKLDAAARHRLGIDFGDTITGTIPIKVAGQIGQGDQDAGMSVEADLTPVKVDNLLPGWLKPAGTPAHVTYTLHKTAKSVVFDDLAITGSGTNVKGSVELNNSGEIMSADFPVFALSSGDKASLKAERTSDGVLRVAMRGDVYDGRNFVKSTLAGHKPEKVKPKETDLDLDIKLGTVAGFNGETLRGLNLRLTRRGGQIRSFTMSSTIGRDTPLTGDLRLRISDNHQVIYFETDDAGALFRFTDMYPRMYGGHMWVAMDPPTQDQRPQVGTLYISNFTVRGEPALQRVVSGAPGQSGGNVQFSEMHANFTRYPGHMSVSDGVVRGPAIGATVEGQIDYVKNDVHLRGTFVPFYGLNNLFGQIPVVGLFLGGGSNEGLLGITYEAVGPPSAPHIRVNPVSAITPGLLRKFIPAPGAFDPKFSPTPAQ